MAFWKSISCLIASIPRAGASRGGSGSEIKRLGDAMLPTAESAALVSRVRREKEVQTSVG